MRKLTWAKCPEAVLDLDPVMTVTAKVTQATRATRTIVLVTAVLAAALSLALLL